MLPKVKEIKSAVWLCDSSKALGADGFNLKFIRRFWDSISNEFSYCIMDFFIASALPRKLNMWVTLTSKFEGA